MYEPGYETELADPCGAGDAFSAGFLHRFLRGEEICQCLQLGTALGAVTASQRGATQKIDATCLEQYASGNPGRRADETIAGLLA